MGRVVDKFVKEVEDQLRGKKITLTLTDAARGWLSEEGFDPDFGARPLARVIQTTLSDRISREILFGALAKGGRVGVDRGESGLVFHFEGR
jgi:ATP-dependent Clp protease ATP-binding subunit ClpA